MQILVKVETGFNCNWREIEPLQPEGFKGQTANEKETLKNSIVKNGFHDAFDVWQHDNKLLSIDGVHRKIALLELAAEGYEIPEQMPCTYVTAENETEAATIILSRNSQHSHIIRAAVLMEACAIPAKMIEAVVPQKNLEAWSESDNSITEQLTAEEDDFEFEDGGIETDIVIGDLFEIGEHRLLCGDSTDSDAVAKLMNGEKADMVFTSPPYNGNTTMYDYIVVNGKKKRKDKPLYENNETDNKTSKEYIDFLHSVMNICFTNTYGYIFWNINYNAKSRFEYIECVYPYRNKLQETIVWKKNAIPTANGLTRNFEFIFMFKTNEEIKHLNKEYDVTHNVWEINNSRSQTDTHKACFPIGLPSKAIGLNESTKLIFDPFIGSGTTIVASHQLKRKCYGMELDPKYCQVIIDRMRKLDPTLIIKRNGVIYE